MSSLVDHNYFIVVNFEDYVPNQGHSDTAGSISNTFSTIIIFLIDIKVVTPIIPLIVYIYMSYMT